MKQVLWLASWYPNKLSPYDGDFLQRHARAVSLFAKVHVIYILKDEAGSLTKSTYTETTVTGNLTEQVVYYASPKTGSRMLDRFLSQKRYDRLYKEAISGYIRKYGRPALCHVQVVMKAGLAALWAKKKWDIPYLVSEQWTGYLENADHRLSDYSLIQRKWVHKILENAASVTTVSHYLGRSMQRHYPFVSYRVIPNVVDTNVFSLAAKTQQDVSTFIHISNMTYQKNTEAILAAFALLSNDTSCRLLLFGSPNPDLKNIVASLKLEGCVKMMGEVPQPGLAEAIQQSDALILYSRFETFGCVLIEANACGVPVIVSDIDVFHELVREGENGRFVKGDDPAALATCIKDFLKDKNRFNGKVIAEYTATAYNYRIVGKQFADLYDELLSKK